MSIRKLVRKHTECGQASVEALLVLMILGMLIFGGIELSQGVAVRQALDSGAGAAARALSLDPTKNQHAEDHQNQQRFDRSLAIISVLKIQFPY